MEASGGVTLNLTDCAADYGRRCEKIGLERRSIVDLQDSMNHPSFKQEHHALLDRLAKEYRNSLPLLERPPRFTLTLGVYLTKENMIQTVEGKGHQFSGYAKGVIANDKHVMLDTPEVYDFWETDVQELTGKKKVNTPDLYAAQYRLGFIDAPHESAPAIREVYDDQPMDEWRYILSKPVADADGYLRVLCVVRDSVGSFVSSRYAGPGDVWGGRARLFVCRKRKPLAS